MLHEHIMQSESLTYFVAMFDKIFFLFITLLKINKAPQNHKKYYYWSYKIMIVNNMLLRKILKRLAIFNYQVFSKI